jgi:hypothetical protein
LFIAPINVTSNGSNCSTASLAGWRRKSRSPRAPSLQTGSHPLASAPPYLRALAHDEEITVSGPVLTQSPRLGANDLIDIARTKSQAHLLAISSRARLSPAVTDVLVERGDGEVAHRVVANEGAAFSETGFAKLIARAGADEALAEGVGRRIDLPPHLFRKLVSEATERVQQRLLIAAKPELQARSGMCLRKYPGRSRPNRNSLRAGIRPPAVSSRCSSSRVAWNARSDQFREVQPFRRNRCRTRRACRRAD